MVRIALISLALSIATSCSVHAADNLDDTALNAFMSDHYGSFDTAKDVWIDEFKDVGRSETAIKDDLNICAHKSLSTANGRRMLLAVCGVSEIDGTPVHPDFFVLKPRTTGKFQVVLSSENSEKYRAGGDGAPKINIEKLGPRLLGFVVVSHNAGMGYTTEDEDFMHLGKGVLLRLAA